MRSAARGEDAKDSLGDVVATVGCAEKAMDCMLQLASAERYSYRQYMHAAIMSPRLSIGDEIGYYRCASSSYSLLSERVPHGKVVHPSAGIGISGIDPNLQGLALIRDRWRRVEEIANSQ